MMKQMSKINSKFKIQLIKIIPIYRTQILVINVKIHLISGKTFGVTAEHCMRSLKTLTNTDQIFLLMLNQSCVILRATAKEITQSPVFHEFTLLVCLLSSVKH